jgi:hypothetical protein
VAVSFTAETVPRQGRATQGSNGRPIRSPRSTSAA